MGDCINEGFLQENVWPFCQAPKKMAVIMRWPYYWGGRKVGFHCIYVIIVIIMSSLGVFSDECSTFLDMMNDIGIDKKQQLYIITKKNDK